MKNEDKQRIIKGGSVSCAGSADRGALCGADHAVRAYFVRAGAVPDLRNAGSAAVLYTGGDSGCDHRLASWQTCFPERSLWTWCWEAWRL